MNKEREIDGIKIVVNGEQYETYKGTLQDQINELQEKIDKAIEYIRSEYTITDDDVYLTLYSSDGTLDKLENILKGDNK